MKLCTDCKHIRRDDTHRLSQCGKFSEPETEVDLVTGRVMGKPIFGWSCYVHREKGKLSARLFGYCGKEGRWWEPKDAGNPGR